jgi:hypothetical protein
MGIPKMSLQLIALIADLGGWGDYFVYFPVCFGLIEPFLQRLTHNYWW